MRIDELSEGDAYHQLGNLVALLIDAVEGGASVSFLAGLTASEAEAFWIAQFEGIPTGRTHLFAAFDGEDIVGCVLLLPADKPNQPHRADVAKLLVMRSARRRGVASLLWTPWRSGRWRWAAPCSPSTRRRAAPPSRSM